MTLVARDRLLHPVDQGRSLVDADDGTVRGAAPAPHPAGTEVDPRAWLRALDEATDGLLERAARRLRRRASSTAWWPSTPPGNRCATRCCGTTSAPRGRRRTSSASGRPAGVRAPGRQRAGGVVHRHQAPLDARPRARAAARVAACCSPTTTSRPPRRAGHRALHRPRGRLRHRLLRHGEDAGGPSWSQPALGHEVALPRVVASGDPAGDTGRRGRWPRGTGDNMGAALGMDLETGDVLVSVGTSGVASAVSPAPVADGTGTSPASPTPPGASCRWSRHSTRRGSWTSRPRWLGVDHAGSPSWPCSRPPAPTAHLLALLRRGADAQPSRCHRRVERPDPARRPAPTWPGRRSRRCCAPGRRRGPPGRPPGRAAAAAAGRRGGPQPRRCGRSPPASSASRSPCPPPGEYVALGAARQAAWALAGTASPPSWPLPGTGRRGGAHPAGARVVRRAARAHRGLVIRGPR